VLRETVAAFVARVVEIEREGIDRASLARIAAALRALAAEHALFNFERFPLPSDTARPVAVYPLHCGADGRHPLQVLSQRYVPDLPDRPANQPHMHPTWAVAAGVHGATRDRLYAREPGTDALRAVDEVRLGPGNTIAMMPQDIHSTHLEPDAPALHLLLYGRALEEVVLFDLAESSARIHKVAAIGAQA
jgi:hypothetical protein